MAKNKKIEEITNRLINDLLMGGKDKVQDGLYNLVQNGTIIINSKNDIIENFQSSSVDMAEKSVRITDKDIESVRSILNKDGLAEVVNAAKNLEESQYAAPKDIDSERGSLYKPIHRPLAMAENGISSVVESEELEQPKARVLSPTPNPWGDAEIVAPGQLKL